MYSDVNFLAYIIFTILSATYSSYYLAVVTGLLISFQLLISHNYFHRKDNFRMMGINLSGSDYTSWRISHVMSHHIYTNSYYDVEVTYIEPFLQWLPRSKTIQHKIFACITTPIVFGVMIPLMGVFR